MKTIEKTIEKKYLFDKNKILSYLSDLIVFDDIYNSIHFSKRVNRIAMFNDLSYSEPKLITIMNPRILMKIFTQ